MNRENIKKVRDVIAELPGQRFDMSDWSWNPKAQRRASPADLKHDCGTAACIAGWAAMLARPDQTEPLDGYTDDVAAEYLDLTFTTATRLFQPITILPENWSKITRDHAVRVLDHLLETGEVNWVSTKRPKRAK